jgi:DNA-binding response OmpR family regulator
VKKILIVEDQVDILYLLKKVLETDTRKIFTAECGKEAIEIAREILPDVILLDIMFPGGIDGYEVARTLKKDQRTANCSIIVMTAKVQEQDRIDAFDAGADDFIGKPFNLADLKNRIAKFI